ncbi:hypothetical protein QL285_096375 [Trifolium repens]|nr:hypothetical protein QL285_096375 [Trifolium repens]
MKEAINIDEEPISLSLSQNQTFDLSKIKIIPLKRKKPEPTIPFDPTKPFFNPISEPNVELLDIAISFNLKRFKRMDEEVLIFPSDIDAKIREMEYLFSQSLKILGNHMKTKIQDRGMTAVRELMGIVERSCAPRLTFYNHEEELQRLQALDAENKRLLRIACEAADRLVREEAAYESMVLTTEQARIAVEVEQARIAAEAEAQKLANVGSQQGEDTTMHDQVINEQASDRGKNVIVDITPPSSPKKTYIPSTSSPIPPAVQAALDNIKAELSEEMTQEIDELRAEMRDDMNASAEAVHKKMDDMMKLLLSAISEIKKP